VIVRGRSPRNFDGRKDVPLSESGRKLAERGEKRGGGDGAAQHLDFPPVKVDPSTVRSSYKFYALNQLQQPLDLPDWPSQTLSSPHTNSLPSPSLDASPHKAKKPSFQSQTLNPTSTPNMPPVPKANWKSGPPPFKAAHSSSTGMSVPIDLSLADEDPLHLHRTSPSLSRAARNIGGASGLAIKEGLNDEETAKDGVEGGDISVHSGRVKKTIGSPVENLELLYEYFPLSLDDWMPPVDAIYRPHVVHHTIVPPDLKAQQVRNKTKRYFSADD